MEEEGKFRKTPTPKKRLSGQTRTYKMKEGRDVDYLLRHVAGGSGPWQVRFLVLAAAVSVPSYLPLFLHLLAAYTPAHRCRVPVCDSRGEVGDDGVVNSWMGFTLPDR